LYFLYSLGHVKFTSSHEIRIVGYQVICLKVNATPSIDSMSMYTILFTASKIYYYCYCCYCSDRAKCERRTWGSFYPNPAN